MPKKFVLVGIWLVAIVAIALIQINNPASDPSANVPAATTTAQIDDGTYGKALFVAKGCASCHAHSAFGSATESIGPVLSNYTVDAPYVRRWLHDPQAIKPTTQMPNLNLSDEEITALIAFLGQ